MELLFHFFHYYGYTPKFFLNKKEKYSNAFDNYLSIAVNIMIVALLVFYEETLRLRKEGTISASIVKPNENKLIDLDSPNQFFVFGLENSNSNHYVDETIYTVQATYRKLKFDKTLQVDKEIDMELVRCNETNKKYDYKLFQTLSLADHYCFKDLSGISLIGDYGDAIWNYIRLTINKCTNGTSSNIICKSQEEIDSTLKGGFFAIYMTDYDIMPDDYYKPVSYSTKDYFTTISPNDYKEIDLFLKNVEMITNDDFFINNNRKEIYYNLETYKEATRGDMGEKVAKIGIRATTVMHVYTRTYKKLLPVLAEFWANSNFIIIVFKCVFFYFEKFLFKVFISSYFSIYHNKKMKVNRASISISKNISIVNNPKNQNLLQVAYHPVKKVSQQPLTLNRGGNAEKIFPKLLRVKNMRKIEYNKPHKLSPLNETCQKIISYENNNSNLNIN